MLARYRERGYAFVCLTDHDRVTRCDVLNGPDFQALPGVEETVVRGMYPLGPHLSRIGVERRLGRGGPQERLDDTWREGGVGILNHPSWKGNLWTGEWPLPLLRRLRGPFLLEIVNPHSNTTEDLRRWRVLLRERPREEAVGGVAADDAHVLGQIDRAWIMVKVPAVTREALLAALRGRAFYATTGPAVEIRLVDGTVGCAGRDIREVAFLDRHGRARATVAGPEARYRPAGDEGFIRVEAGDGAGGRVWSQPFWIEAERSEA